MTNRAQRNIAPARQPAAQQQKELTVIILAAKMGKRMKQRGPKPLFHICNGITILDTQLNSIWMKYPNADIIIVSDFEYEKIRDYVRAKRYPARVVINPDHADHGMIHGLSIGLQAAVSRNLLVMYGDLVVCPKALNLLGNASAIHGARFRETERPQDEIGVAIGENMNVTNLAYGLPHKWCQMAYFTGREFDMLEEIAFSPHAQNWMMHEGINEIINNRGGFISYYLSDSSVIDVDSQADLEEARKLYD